MIVDLPISKSIAQRELLLRAVNGEDLSGVLANAAFTSYPDDVQLLVKVLCQLSTPSPSRETERVFTCNLRNNATAFRFLTAYCAQKPGCDVVLDGAERMHHRPVGQLVDALRSLGADITYLCEEEFPPLRIQGKSLRRDKVVLRAPQSTQFVSALRLIGVEVETNCQSPYLILTESVIAEYNKSAFANHTFSPQGYREGLYHIERDWSAAAFWLERQALGLGEYSFPGLSDDSLQGDRVARELFRQIADKSLSDWDFSACPDLYPAAAVACYCLDLHPRFTGLESLRIKESDRIAAVEENIARIRRREFPLCSYADHRIAMAFLAAGFPVDDTVCIRKSYPAFLSQLLDLTRVVAVRHADFEQLDRSAFDDGLTTLFVDDEGKGKKFALSKAMRQVTTRYVWLTDADILPPANYELSATNLSHNRNQMADSLYNLPLTTYNLLILPLQMSAGSGSLIERLQVLEYEAIQALTILSAEKGHPVMCAGANMIVEREAWLACESNLHPELPSGDDMFLLEAMKRRGMKIGVSRELVATCTPCPSLASLLRQRMRWAGKAPHYTDRDIRLVGALTIVSNLLVIFLPGWFVIKWLADYALIKSPYSPGSVPLNHSLDGSPSQNDKGDSVRNQSPTSLCQLLIVNCQLLIEGLFLTLIYPWYMLICLIGGLFRREW